MGFCESPSLGQKKRENSVTNLIPTVPGKLQLPVEVIGSDLYGQQFFELARTLTIHRNGVSLLLANKVAPDSELIVRNSNTGEEAVAFVVGQIREDDAGHVYGLAFVDPSADLWHIQFPAAEAAKLVQLECNGCHSVCTLSLSGIELEIFDARRELVHSCITCNSSGTWRETNHEVAKKLPGNPPERKPNPPSIASPTEERRKNRRTKMKMTACVRFSGLEDVVVCEDISKGGFRFIGRKEYPEGLRVEVSVPYTKSSNNMFSLASIVYCHKMPDGQFRHGTSYTKTSGSIGWDPYDQ
jgi:PilZ domain